MPDRLPDFLGVGTQKGGTTSLYHWLNVHPQVFLPECKEVHYFDLNSNQPIDWYAKHFQDAKSIQKCGEITPFYLFHPNAAERIFNAIPDVKIIVLLRDPADRAISQIFHSRERGYENLTPKKALEAEKSRLEKGSIESMQKHSYISRSMYLIQLERYEKLFKKDQILVLKSEDMFQNHKEFWIKIQNFLELDMTKEIKKTPVANKGNDYSMEVTHELRENLRKKLKETALGIRDRYDFGWDWA